MTHFKALLSFAAFTFVTFALLGASFAESISPMNYVKAGYKTVISALDKPVAERDMVLRGIIGLSIDHDDLAMRSLGKEWGTLKPEQQLLYRSTFKELIEQTYVQSLGRQKPNTDYTVEWEDESQKGDRGRVVVFVMHEDTETEVEFTLIKKEDSWMIYDLAYEGASMESTYQKNYGKIVREEGFDSLIKKMNNRIKDLKDKK